MTTTIILLILFIHWVADFVCQSDWQAKNKSKNNEALLNHVFIYSALTLMAWSLFGFVNKGIYCSLAIFLITFICHFITDYITSRINSKLYAQGKIHYFFVSIGFDQLLHYAQLFFMYEFLVR